LLNSINQVSDEFSSFSSDSIGRKHFEEKESAFVSPSIGSCLQVSSEALSALLSPKPLR
jgi:hypothetical protein